MAAKKKTSKTGKGPTFGKFILVAPDGCVMMFYMGFSELREDAIVYETYEEAKEMADTILRRYELTLIVDEMND